MGRSAALALDGGSRVGVIGGGPAGSFFSYFLLQLAHRLDIDVCVDIYEWRDFSVPGPASCNMCAGVISESLVQALAVEGINLPPTVVQRGVNSYVMHTETESVTMYTPLHEMRIATVHRGSGPRGVQETKWASFDGYLMQLAIDKGANLVRGRVSDIAWDGARPRVEVREGEPQTYDLLVGAVGVNSPSLGLFEKLGIRYRRPKVRRAFVMELGLGLDFVNNRLGGSMHVFLLNLPGLDFAALVPKGEYVTVCLIGTDIDRRFADSFLRHPTVQECLPEKMVSTEDACHCSPHLSTGGAVHPFADRVVLIGDCGVTRLNKDGLGAAYRTAKVAAMTAVFEGVSSADFRKHYWPVCRAISRDNNFGKLMYAIVAVIKKMQYPTQAVVRMTRDEQLKEGEQRRMSMVLWDMFTGSAAYRTIFLRTLHPYFVSRFVKGTVAAVFAASTDGSKAKE
jgi:flavin-dependent dehydrogenase